MGRKNKGGAERVYNRAAWTAEEDTQLSHYIQIHGPKKWRTVATKSGLNRCRKSSILTWLNYLRPNIKRGNISGDKEDLILRLHKLLGNRLPGRSDNERKNYWNSHLSKKMNQKEEKTATSMTQDAFTKRDEKTAKNKKDGVEESGDADFSVDVNEFFYFSSEGIYGLKWVNKFLDQDI